MLDMWVHDGEDTALLLLGYYEKWLMDRCGRHKALGDQFRALLGSRNGEGAEGPGTPFGTEVSIWDKQRRSGGRWQGWAAPLGASLSINAHRLSAHVQSAWFGSGYLLDG
ncbi:hypothetical protein B0H11DRAFT_1926486 [Mycena galericulata]|nr:hypothetical protein B0H11DRAFT_1926486 [Mycena galericulata]